MEADIEKIVDGVIADKEAQGKMPQCDLHEIIRAIVPEIISEMRQLVKEGKYEGAVTINKVPMVIKK